jgi:hypothetical protein
MVIFYAFCIIWFGSFMEISMTTLKWFAFLVLIPITYALFPSDIYKNKEQPAKPIIPMVNNAPIQSKQQQDLLMDKLLAERKKITEQNPQKEFDMF